MILLNILESNTLGTTPHSENNHSQLGLLLTQPPQPKNVMNGNYTSYIAVTIYHVRETVYNPGKCNYKFNLNPDIQWNNPKLSHVVGTLSGPTTLNI